MLVLCKLRYVSATRAPISGGIVPVCQRAAEWSDGVRLVYMISMSGQEDHLLVGLGHTTLLLIQSVHSLMTEALCDDNIPFVLILSQSINTIPKLDLSRFNAAYL
jgi:hypothetical protein